MRIYVLRKTAAFCTDSVGSGQNAGQYKEGGEIELIPTLPEKIFKRIMHYYEHPEALAALGDAGAERARILYSGETQLVPRIQLLEDTLEKF